MADQNFSSDSNNQIDPLLTSDPLVVKKDDVSEGNSSNTPIPPISESVSQVSENTEPIISESEQVPEQPSTQVSDSKTESSVAPTEPMAPKPLISPELNPVASKQNEVLVPENKDEARVKANELMDQGKFSEAAIILKESGIHQTKTPKPQPEELDQNIDNTTPPTPKPTPMPQPPTPKPTPMPQPPIPKPTPMPQPPIPKPTQVPSNDIDDMLSGHVVSEEKPNDYLKKAYNIRKELIEYDRTKVVEEEKLQAAEELFFEGNKEKAIEMYKQIAREAEEKQEREVSIEAYERLAALTR